MKNIILIILILLLIYGILFGHFRRKGKLTAEQEQSIKGVIRSQFSDAETQGKFSGLWHDHVDLTRQFALAYLHNDPKVDSIEKDLLQNQTNISIAVNDYYPGSQKLIEDLLKEHILVAKDIVVDLKEKRLNRIVGDINKWYQNSDTVSGALQKLNPKWNLKDHFNNHLKITEQEVLAEFSGLQKLSEQIYNKEIVPQAQDMANIMANGLK